MELIARDGTIAVQGADDCTSLSVQVSVADQANLDTLLRRTELGFWTGGAEVEINIVELRRRGEAGEVGPDWAHRWDGMIRYAQSKGWVSTDGQYVRAHIRTGHDA